MQGLYAWSTPTKMAIAMGLNFVFQAIILWLLYPKVSPELLPLDVRFGLTQEEVTEFFQLIGELGRNWYFYNEVTLDMAFPVVYGLAYSLLAIELVKVLTLQETRWRFAPVLPLVIAFSDVCENMSIIILLDMYPESNQIAMDALILANAVKHSLTLISLLVLLFLIGWWGKRKFNPVDKS